MIILKKCYSLYIHIIRKAVTKQYFSKCFRIWLYEVTISFKISLNTADLVGPASVVKGRTSLTYIIFWGQFTLIILMCKVMLTVIS